MPIFVDHSGRSAGPRGLVALGLVAVLAVAAAAVVLTGYGEGRFADTVTVRIDTATVGEGLVPGAEVKLHGYAIGSVRRVETVGENRQRLQLALDRRQAAQLTDRVSARYSSSNLFGTTVIELLPQSGGNPLRDNMTLHIGADSPTATVTEILRRAGRLTSVLDTDTARHLFDLLAEAGGALGISLRSLFDTAATLADNRQGPIAHYLDIGADLGAGAAALTPPAVDLIGQMLDSSSYFGEPANRDRTNRATDGLRDIMLEPLAGILTAHNGELATVIDTAMDLAVPLAMSLGSFAPAYQRVPALLDHIEQAFPVVDGRVQLRVELRVIAEHMPYLLASLVPAPEGTR